VARYISDYLLPRLCPSSDVSEIIKDVTNNNKIQVLCERLCPGIQAKIVKIYLCGANSEGYFHTLSPVVEGSFARVLMTNSNTKQQVKIKCSIKLM
jgi:hypothetical protein